MYVTCCLAEKQSSNCTGIIVNLVNVFSAAQPKMNVLLTFVMDFYTVCNTDNYVSLSDFKQRVKFLFTLEYFILWNFVHEYYSCTLSCLSC